MKIVIFVYHFLPNWLAGVEIGTYQIARNLSKLGNEVHIITTMDKGLSEFENTEGFFVHRIKLFEHVKLMRMISFWISIVSVVRSIDPDILHVQGVALSPPALCCRLIYKKRYIIWFHEPYHFIEYSDSFIQNKIYTFLSRGIIYRYAMKYAECLVVLTESMKKELNNVIKFKRIDLIPNGVDIHRFDHENLKQKSSKRNENFFIIWVGRFHPGKAVEFLIKAINILVNKGENVKLILIGEGPKELELKALVDELNINSYINFVGKVSNDKIPEFMLQSDIFVLPSIYEAFPLVLLEAMAAGLPIIATNIEGISEIIHDGENGFLVEARNPSAIADTILLLEKDRELMKRISNHNQEFVKNYSWESISSRLNELYLSCI